MGLLDPYARPAGELSETEKRIFVAAFAAREMSTGVLGRTVPVVAGRPVLLSDNHKADVLLVSVQTANPIVPVIIGLFGSGPQLFNETAFRADISAVELPFQQILLPKEQLWFKPLFFSGSLVVTEVTP